MRRILRFASLGALCLVISAATAAGACTTIANPGVAICTPAANAVVGSPVAVWATTNDSYAVKLVQVYVDGVKKYEVAGSMLNTSLSLAQGTHRLTVQAYDTVNRIFKSSIYTSVGAATTGASITPVSASTTTSGHYASNLNSAGAWISGPSMILPDGAILYGADATRIVPYYSNIAAIGMTKDPATLPRVQAWMQWYISHLNWPDKWGLYGTTYDYDIVGSAEVPSNNADSTDSYAATFLSLAWNYYKTGDGTAQSYVKSILYQLDAIGGVLVQTTDSDGLTWAKPDYHIKYLMDNCEAYRGMRDLAQLFQAVGNSNSAAYYNAHADQMLKSIEAMWTGSTFAPYKDALGRLAPVNWSTWYADATSQLFPVLEGVLPASDARVQSVYAQFNSHWPGWPNLSFNSTDPFPWVLVGGAAALMGDSARTNTYITTLQNKYVNKDYPWPWYSAENGWFMRLNSYMGGRGW